MATKIINSVKNQTVFDIAVQHYGDVDMFVKVIELNPHLKNDYSAAIKKGVPFENDVLDLSYPLKEETEIIIETAMVDIKIAQELKDKEVISFHKNILEL